MSAAEPNRSGPGTAESVPLLAARLRSPAAIAATALVAGGVAAAQDSVAASVLRGVLVIVVVACGLTDLERRIIPNRITGPAALLGLALGLALDPGGEPERLLWVAHHLVVDGVSWRVLLEDLESAYRQAVLPPKTASFRDWARRTAAPRASCS